MNMFLFLCCFWFDYGIDSVADYVTVAAVVDDTVVGIRRNAKDAFASTRIMLYTPFTKQPVCGS